MADIHHLRVCLCVCMRAYVSMCVYIKHLRLVEKSLKDYNSIVGKGAETRDRLKPNVCDVTLCAVNIGFR